MPRIWYDDSINAAIGDFVPAGETLIAGRYSAISSVFMGITYISLYYNDSNGVRTNFGFEEGQWNDWLDQAGNPLGTTPQETLDAVNAILAGPRGAVTYDKVVGLPTANSVPMFAPEGYIMESGVRVMGNNVMAPDNTVLQNEPQVDARVNTLVSSSALQANAAPTTIDNQTTAVLVTGVTPQNKPTYVNRQVIFTGNEHTLNIAAGVLEDGDRIFVRNDSSDPAIIQLGAGSTRSFTGGTDIFSINATEAFGFVVGATTITAVSGLTAANNTSGGLTAGNAPIIIDNAAAPVLTTTIDEGTTGSFDTLLVFTGAGGHAVNLDLDLAAPVRGQSVMLHNGTAADVTVTSSAASNAIPFDTGGTTYTLAADETVRWIVGEEFYRISQASASTAAQFADPNTPPVFINNLSTTTALTTTDNAGLVGNVVILTGEEHLIEWTLADSFSDGNRLTILNLSDEEATLRLDAATAYTFEMAATDSTVAVGAAREYVASADTLFALDPEMQAQPIVPFATQAEAVAGTAPDRVMAPASVTSFALDRSYDRFRGTIGQTSGDNRAFPAGNRGDYVQAVNAPGTVNGVALQPNRMYRCTANGTPANTAANWQIQPVAFGTFSVFENINFRQVFPANAPTQILQLDQSVRTHEIYVTGLGFNAGNSLALLRFRRAGQSAFDTGNNYRFTLVTGQTQNNGSLLETKSSSQSTNAMRICNPILQNADADGKITLFGAADPNRGTVVHSEFSYLTPGGGGYEFASLRGQYLVNGALEFILISGNINASKGVFAEYGRN